MAPSSGAALPASIGGEPASGFCELYSQSAYDDSVAPPGREVMSVFCQYVPYELADGKTWERYDRAIELSNRSLRENRLHTPTLRTLAAAFVLSKRPEEARETMRALRQLEPGLTVSALRARYPGRDSPQASRFSAALLEAGLPP